MAILSLVVSLLARLWEEVQARRDLRSLSARYGRGSYVLITGGSDGYGKAFAFSFASRGLNIILAARNFEKLQKVREEILQAHPQTKVELYVCDFSHSLEAGFFAKLFAFTSRFDMSVVVNNVGLSYPDYFNSYEFKNKSPEKLVEVMVTNCVPQACLHRLYFPIFKERTRRSAFVDVSSICAYATSVGVDIYGSTKLFNAYLCKSLAVGFHDHNIDYTVVHLGTVSTKLISWFKDAFGTDPPFCISADAASESAMLFIGHSLDTHGHIKHFATGLISQAVSFIDDTLPVVLGLSSLVRIKAASQKAN